MRSYEMYKVTFKYFLTVCYRQVSPWRAALWHRRRYHCGAQSSDKTDALYNHCKPTSKVMYFCSCHDNRTFFAEPEDSKPLLSTSAMGYFPDYCLPLVVTASLSEIHIDLNCPSRWYRGFFLRYVPIRFRYSGFDINAFLSLDHSSVVPSQESRHGSAVHPTA
jgi:hypothetical protein